MSNQLNRSVEGHTLWFWIARGARRADNGPFEYPEYDSDHFHNWRGHIGWYGSYSAADYCQDNFDTAVALWNRGMEVEAMYHLGIALHNVQDLRVAFHNWPEHKYDDPHKSYESAINYSENRYRDDVRVYSGGIYQDDSDFKPFYTYNQEPYLHQPNDEPWGWVDRSAHVSRRWESQSKADANAFDRKHPHRLDTVKTAPLVRSAQSFSAGFIKFFFDQVNLGDRFYGGISGLYDCINVGYGGEPDVLVEVGYFNPDYDPSNPESPILLKVFASTRTDSQGRYLFTHLPPGKWTVVFHDPWWGGKSWLSGVIVYRGRITFHADLLWGII